MNVRRTATLIAVLFLSSSIFAQTQTTGRIAGTIRDQNGAVIVGANVVITNQANGEARTTTTDPAGNYAFAFLAPAVYRVRIEASGFNVFNAETVTVNISETTTINATLSVAGVVVDPITINNVAPLVKTDSSTLGQVIDGRTISEFPLPTRNFTQLLGLAAGTATYLPDSNVVGRNTQNASVNGSRFTQNNFQINGVDANAGILADLPLANPALESIGEFKVQTSLYDATTGRAGGGNIQIVTKSGTNAFHGAIYDYFRNTALNANNPFLKAVDVPRPVLERNIFGATFGGPLKKDRAFFFVSYQTTRELNGASFWNSLSVNVGVHPLLTNDRSEQTLSSSFGLPSIHPTALMLLNARLPNGQFLIPTPQAGGYFSGSAISSFRDEQFNTNFDYRINQRNLLSVKFFFSDAPQVFALGDQTTIPGVSIKQQNSNRILSVQDTHTFNSNIINSARFGYNFIGSHSFPQQEFGNSDFGITRSTASGFPGLPLISIAVAGFGLQFGTGWFEDGQTTAPTISFADTISITRGRHTFRLGAEVLAYRFDFRSNALTRGQIIFNSFSNFLSGATQIGLLANGIKERDLRTADYNFFVQDDWKISPRLTLNLGLRYELDLPPYDTKGRISAFDPSLYLPPPAVGGLPSGGFVQAGNAIPAYDLLGIPNVSKRVVNSLDPNNIAPRIGFAFTPFKSNRFVVRGGYGIYYWRPSFQSQITNMYLPPFYFVSLGLGRDLRDPFEPVPTENEFPTLEVGPLGLVGSTFDRNNRTPYVQQYNVSTQFALKPNTLLEIAYVGTRGLRLFRQVAFNQARLASPGHPINNITTNTPRNARFRAPFQGVGVSPGATGFTQDQTSAQSTYNSLQLTLTRRLSDGLQFLASYTWSKSLDNASGTGGGSGTFGLINPVRINDTSGIIGNQLDNRANRGVSSFDRTHRFVLSFIWELPKPAFARSSKAGRLLLSGWQMAGIVTAMSGLPIDVVDSGAGTFYGGSGRPNWVPGESATSNIPPGYYFNPFAFASPIVLAGEFIPSSGGTATASETGTDFGNVGRNVLRGPRQFNMDLSINKRFRFSETKNIEFRAEFFNLFNTVNFANPISNFNAVVSFDPNTGRINDPGDFGKIISTSNNPRLIQFAVKLNF